MSTFKSKKKFIILAIVSIILMGGLIYNYLFSPSPYPIFAPIDKQEMLTNEEFIEDFDFMYETLMSYYPYFDVNKKVHKIDWLENRAIYRDKVSQCKTGEEFYEIMNYILSDLHNGHTHLLGTDYGLQYYVLYKSMPRFDWRVHMAKIFEKPRVQARYAVTNENIDKILEAQANYEPKKTNDRNVTIGDVIPKKAGYIAIKQMITPDLSLPSFKAEYEIIKSYLEKVKDYPILIIDIRQNGGGNSNYWSEFLMPLIVDRSYSQKTYTFIKEGPLFSKIRRQSGFKKLTNDIILGFNFPGGTFNMIKDFSYFGSHTGKVVPHKDSIKFKGKIYFLVDKHVYSSSEKLASFAKESKLATLVGERTGGDGIGSDPMLVDLPNSGYILRFSKEMGVTEKGSINELDQTEPDILVSNPIKKIDFDSNGQAIFNGDQAIFSIIEREGI